VYSYFMESMHKLSFRALARNPRLLFIWLVMAFVILVTSFVFCPDIAYAGNAMTVVYPVYHNDADRIITEVRDGLHESLKNNINEIAYDAVEKSRGIQNKISSLSDDDIVITLTNDLEGLVRTSGFKGQLIDGVSENFTKRESTVSVGIEPSPEVYVETLTRLQPDVRKIYYFTFTNGNESEKEIARLRLVSRKQQIGLEHVVVDNINDAMHKLNDVIDKSDPSKDALWIPNNVLSMANNTVLKYVLRAAWRKSLMVFTDSLDAVARGLLFSLIPDYRAYGEYLGHLSIDLSVKNDPPVPESIRYFDDVYLMLNQRFAVHIGLNINRSVIEKYKIVVPAK